jgi:hypothetical protein
MQVTREDTLHDLAADVRHERDAGLRWTVIASRFGISKREAQVLDGLARKYDIPGGRTRR